MKTNNDLLKAIEKLSVHDHLCLIYDKDGKPLRSVGTVQDITERKKSEEALKERLDELTRFERATIQREFRMHEIKEENERLKERIKEMEMKKS